MSAEVVTTGKMLSPTSSLDPEKRPGSLPFSSSNSPSHHHRQPSCSHCGKIQTNVTSTTNTSDSPSSSNDGGLGGSVDEEGENENVESSHRSSSGISSCSASSPGRESGEDADLGEMESSYKRKCFQQRGGAASWPLPHTQNGIYKMPTKARLQKLLTEMASQDQSYSGLDDDSEPEPITMDNLSLGETGPTSFSPLRGTPNSQPPSLYSYRAGLLDSPFYHMSSLASRDGVTSPAGSGVEDVPPRKKGGVWTLNLIDGNLFLFRANPMAEVPPESEVEMEGIELAKLLTKKKPSDADTDDTDNPNKDCYYYHLPTMIVDVELNNPHVSPVFTPETGSKYCICRQNDPTKMTPTEYILHHNKIFLVLEEKDPPVINAITQDQMMALLEKMAEEGKTYFDVSYNIVVNIKSEAGHARSPTRPNNISIYFTGKNKQFRYYVTVNNDTGRLTALAKPLPLPFEDWKNHLEFSNTYFTPSGMVAMATGSPGHDLASIKETEGEENQ